MLTGEAIALLAKVATEPRRLVVPFLLPGRNELDAAQRRRRRWSERGEGSAYVELKRKAQSDVMIFAAAARRTWPPLGAAPVPPLIVCEWREPTRRRDPGNIVDGGRKILLDALGPSRGGARGWLGAGLLHCDGWHCTRCFVDVVTHRPDAPGVVVVVAPLQMELRLPAPLAAVDLRAVSGG